MSSSTPTSSSISGTSSSYAATVDLAEVFRSKDCSPLDLESDIQSQRIAKILASAIYKTKLAICLPILVEERETLCRILKPKDLEELFTFCKYVNEKSSMVHSLIDMEAVENIESGDTRLRHRLCPEMAYFICMLTRYGSLKAKVEETIEKIREDYNMSFTHEGMPLPPGFPYLLELEKLCNLTLARTCKSAAEVLYADITATQLEIENRKLVERIQEVLKILPEEKRLFEENMIKKNRQISLLQKELIKCGQVSNAKRKQTVRTSNYQMLRLTNAHNERRSVVKDIEVESRLDYDKILNGNVSQETTLRAKRRKVESQLNAFIAKYDADMMEKQKELDEVKSLYDEEEKLCRNLKLKLAEQHKEFEPLMLERDEEYHTEMTEKMNSFMVEHAARVIQNSWQQVGANRVEKKRLRNVLKKMQNAKENPEIRDKVQEDAIKKVATNAKKTSKSATTSEGSEEKSD